MTREFGWKMFRGMDASACPSVKYSNSCHFIHPSLSLFSSVWYRYIFLLIFILFSICSTSNLLLATQTRLQTKVTRLPTIILQYVKHTSFKIDIRKVNTREWRLGSEFIIVRLVFIHHFASISVAFMYNIARQFYKGKGHKSHLSFWVPVSSVHCSSIPALIHACAFYGVPAFNISLSPAWAIKSLFTMHTRSDRVLGTPCVSHCRGFIIWWRFARRARAGLEGAPFSCILPVHSSPIKVKSLWLRLGWLVRFVTSSILCFRENWTVFPSKYGCCWQLW